VSVTSIRVTEEMKQAVAQYRIAAEAHKRATNEAHIRFWEQEMNRHRANLMSIMDGRLGDIEIPNPRRRRRVFFIEPDVDSATEE